MTFAVVVMQNSKGITHHIGDHHRNHWVKFDIMNSKDCRGNQRRTISSVFAVAVYIGFKGIERSMEWRREREMKGRGCQEQRHTKKWPDSKSCVHVYNDAVHQVLRHLSFSSPLHRAFVPFEPHINCHWEYWWNSSLLIASAVFTVHDVEFYPMMHVMIPNMMCDSFRILHHDHSKCHCPFDLISPWWFLWVAMMHDNQCQCTKSREYT